MSDRQGLYRRVKWPSLVIVLLSVMVPLVVFQTSAAAAAYNVHDGHLQEVQVSFSNQQSKDTDDDGPEHDPEDDHRGGPRRQRRQSTMSSNPQLIVDKLNDIRRSASASNMYYVSVDQTLPQYTELLVTGTQSCILQSNIEVDQSEMSTVETKGFTGYLDVSTNIGEELVNIYQSGSTDPINPFYAQIITSCMVTASCKVGSFLCSYIPQSGDQPSSLPPPNPQRPSQSGRPRTPPGSGPPRSNYRQGYVFACMFGYTRLLNQQQHLYTIGSSNCSNCDSDAVRCDRGLCRISCSSKAVSSCDDTCQQMCSNCDSASDRPDCGCLCYYGNGQTRCSNDGVSPTQPLCSAPPPPPSRHPPINQQTLVALAVVSSILLLVILCLVSCCIHRRCRNRSSDNTRADRRQSSGHCTPVVSPVSTVLDGTLYANDAIASIIVPPSYDFVARQDLDLSLKPPSYFATVHYTSSPPAYNDEFHVVPSAPSVLLSTSAPASSPVAHTIDSLPQPISTPVAETGVRASSHKPDTPVICDTQVASER